MSKTVQACLLWGQNLLEVQGIEDTHLSSKIVLGHVLAQPPSYLMAYPEALVNHTQYDVFQSLIYRRAKHEPIAYIIGEKEFYGLPFKVNKNVLIPRPETEMMIDLVLNAYPYDSVCTCLDVGTGSGAIALTVKRHRPDFDVVALDVSDKALDVARENAALLKVDVTFLNSNLLEHVNTQGVDILLANLPYISSDDIQSLSKDVLHEPKLALDGGSKGLDLYAQLLEQAKAHLNKDAHLLFEIGFDQKEGLKNLCKIYKYKWVTAHKDLSGHDRVIEMRRG